LVDERGTSSTCPACRRRIPKPGGRVSTCPHCAYTGHRDLTAAATIATRTPGGEPTTVSVIPTVVTHRRAGRHLPGTSRAGRAPRRPQTAPRGGWPAEARPPKGGEPRARTRGEDPQHHRQTR